MHCTRSLTNYNAIDDGDSCILSTNYISVPPPTTSHLPQNLSATHSQFHAYVNGNSESD